MTLDTAALDNDVLRATEDDTLISLRAQVQDQIDELFDARDRIDYALTKSMEGRSATAISHPDYNVALEPPAPKYDPGVLQRVFEYVSTAEMTASGAYIPGHQEPVPAKFNMTKLKPLAKYHGDIKQIIEDAKLLGPAVISVKRKRKRGNDDN